jgi:hypothetical protein
MPSVELNARGEESARCLRPLSRKGGNSPGARHTHAESDVPGDKDVDKRRLLAQLRHLDGNYSGGLRAYLRNSKRLLEDSRLGVRP